MAIRKSTEEDFEIAENVEALLKRCTGALEAGGFKNIKAQELTSTMQAEYKRFPAWGEVSITLFRLADNRTKINVKATANYDNIYALFSSPNQKIIRSFRNALNGAASPVSSESGKGFQWKWIAIAIVALVIIGAVFGKPKNASSSVALSGDKAVDYHKGAEINIASNNLDDFLGRLGVLVELIKGKPKDQCFDLVYMDWQDFEKLYNQGSPVYEFKYQVSQELKYVSIGQLPNKLCGIEQNDAEEMFKQRRLLTAKLSGASTMGDSNAPVAVAQTTSVPNPVNISYPEYAESEIVVLHGRLVAAPGETPDGGKVMFRAIQLAKSITVKGDSVKLMQLVLDGKTSDQYAALSGKLVSVKGRLFDRDNGNQRTPVLMTAIEITPSGE
ncbi:DUF4431 domain-containing protein [Sideroxyarcus sp. TK5]